VSTTTLPDGRDLELELNGPDHGPVIVFHHGTPGCVVAPTGARTRRGGARTSLRHHLAARVRRVIPTARAQRGRRRRRHRRDTAAVLGTSRSSARSSPTSACRRICGRAART